MTPINIQEYVAQNTELLFRTLRELCAIPAPSGMEDERAAYCKTWLENAGAEGVYIDSAKNTVFPLSCDGKDTITAVVAHTDTVFPDTEPMPYLDDGEKIFCPGVGDDTASLSVLLLCAKYCIEQNLRPREGLLFVCNSCEEGLGNLKGTRQLFRDYEGRIARFISFDSKLGIAADRSVGSHRYRVEVKTAGGHSYHAFGNQNAIAELSKLIGEIYQIDVPTQGNSRTTYNVGNITGGTSVNTIAEQAEMLCEYRSDNRECLEFMKARFEKIFADASDRGVDVRVTLIGDRPCMGEVDLGAIDRMTECYRNVVRNVSGTDTKTCSSSTDCNIPLSLGIPALCVGVMRSNGSHTRGEWLDKASFPQGAEVGLRFVLELVEE